MSYQGQEPPGYAEATADAPPSYESLYGELREVDSPKTFGSFLVKVFGVILGSAAAVILILLFNIIPVAMIVIGAINLHNCEAERYIPIWLIVSGAVSMIKSVLNLAYRAKRRVGSGRDAEIGLAHDPSENVKPNPCDGLLSCFMLAWFIAGTVWVYRTRPGNIYNNTHPSCDVLTYNVAWWLITLSYVLLVGFVLFMCCCGCCVLAASSKRRDRQTVGE